MNNTLDVLYGACHREDVAAIKSINGTAERLAGVIFSSDEHMQECQDMLQLANRVSVFARAHDYTTRRLTLSRPQTPKL